MPRSVPDGEFNEIFARLPSHRDRALVAFYISTGARASELLSTWQAGADPGRQLISVVRKGTGEIQELPASTDAFVWLRLYQLEMGFGEYSTHELGIQPDAYETKLDVDFTPLRDQDLTIRGFGQAA